MNFSGESVECKTIMILKEHDVHTEMSVGVIEGSSVTALVTVSLSLNIHLQEIISLRHSQDFLAMTVQERSTVRFNMTTYIHVL